MDDRHRAGPVRMRVGDRCRAMRCPAGVADAGLAGQGLVHEKVREVHELADRAAAVEPAVVDGGDPGGIVAAVLQPLQGLDENRRDLMVPENPDDTAHYCVSFCCDSFLKCNISNNLVAKPCLLTWRARATAIALSGTSCVMTEPEAVIAPAPTRTGATSIVSEPMKARAPISVRCFITPS